MWFPIRLLAGIFLAALALAIMLDDTIDKMRGKR